MSFRNLFGFRKPAISMQEAIEQYNRGNRYRRNGDYLRAVECYTAAIKGNPDLFQALHNRGEAYAAFGKYREAISDYTEVIRLLPGDPLPYTNRGNSWAYSGSYAEAVADYESALRLNPSFAPALSGRGNAHGAMGNYERSLADHEAALRIEPENGSFWFNKAHTCDAMGRTTDALQAYRMALKFGVTEAEAKIAQLKGVDGTKHLISTEMLAQKESNVAKRDSVIIMRGGGLYAVPRGASVRPAGMTPVEITCPECRKTFEAYKAELRQANGVVSCPRCHAEFAVSA